MAVNPRGHRLGAVLVAVLLCGCSSASSQRDSATDIDSWTDGLLGDIVGERQVIDLPASAVDLRLDPYGRTPLAALAIVAVDPQSVQSVSVRLKAEDGADDLKVDLPYDHDYAERYGCPDLVGDGSVGVPVLGLLAARTNRVIIAVSTADTVYRLALAIKTASLHPSLPTIRVVAKDEELMEPGWNLATFMASENGFKPRPFIFDNEGRIRWYYRADEAIGLGFTTPIEPLANGNLLLSLGNLIYQISLLGREVNRWLLPSGFVQHHDVGQMPDGGLLVCAEKKATIIPSDGSERTSFQDHVVELDRQGVVRNIWDLRTFLDIDRYDYMKTGRGDDWFHLNSVIYDQRDDSIIISGKHQGVAKISRGGANPQDPYRGKTLRWILAAHQGWNTAGFDGGGFDLRPFLLKAVDAAGEALSTEIQQGTESTPQFGWSYSQHAPVILPDGTLFLFDNGWRRDMRQYEGEPFSRGVVYQITPAGDRVGGTVQQVWEYGRERGAELYDPVISDVDFGDKTGNYFILPGSYTTQADGTPGGVAKMVEVRPSDKRIVFEAHIQMSGTAWWGDDMCYRQERMPLYR